MRLRKVGGAILLATVVVAGSAALSLAVPLIGDGGLLPAGTDLGEPALEVPRQILTVEREGSEQTFLIALGNLAFGSPQIMGGLARRAGISCNSCHISGEANVAFFFPGLSAQPGSVDVSNEPFNHAFDDGVFNPLDIPSLRGIKHTAPYGRDGREASLHAFVRNVLVNEFAGEEPAPLILDALVAYMQQFEFLPNPKIGPAGELARGSSDAPLRGEALFRRPFDTMGGQSCASCHMPSALFLDGRSHDVGTGGYYDTPTLLNASFTAPYFHDGRAARLEDVVSHFDRTFELGLEEVEQADLVAYLQTIGDGLDPSERKDFAFDMKELQTFAGLLDAAIERQDADLVRLIVDTVNADLREIAEQWYRPADRHIRGLISGWAIQLRRVASQAGEGAWREAAAARADYRNLLEAEVDEVAAGTQRSLYDPKVLDVYLDEIQALSALRPFEAVPHNKNN
jgi:mono/diheme cytochrome c family protein